MVKKAETVGSCMKNHNQDSNNFQEHTPKKYFPRHLQTILTQSKKSCTVLFGNLKSQIAFLLHPVVPNARLGEPKEYVKKILASENTLK